MSFLWWWKIDYMRKLNVNTLTILLSRHGERIMFVVHLTVDKWMLKSVILLPYISCRFNHCDIDRTKTVFVILNIPKIREEIFFKWTNIPSLVYLCHVLRALHYSLLADIQISTLSTPQCLLTASITDKTNDLTFLLKYKFIYFNWRLIALQYCSGFCHTLTWIHHGCTCIPHPEPPSHLPPHPIPLGHPSAQVPSTLSHASNLDWRSISHMIIYMFQCHSPKSSHPRPLPQSPKDCSIHLCLFFCLAYRVIITIFLNSIYMC